MSKYDPLRARLMGDPKAVRLTFGEVSVLVGSLPPSAYVLPQWWSNNPSGHVQARAWLTSRRRVERVDFAAREVMFSERRR